LQNRFHDGGFSNMGISDEIMQMFLEGQEEKAKKKPKKK